MSGRPEPNLGSLDGDACAPNHNLKWWHLNFTVLTRGDYHVTKTLQLFNVRAVSCLTAGWMGRAAVEVLLKMLLSRGQAAY
jgi:hypothetical protein